MKSILSAVVGATLALSAIEADAQAAPGERQVSLTIESTSLATALDKWAQQSGFQIFVQDWEATKNLTARSLKGTFTAQDALEQLLSGTPLTYVWISNKAVSIRKKTPQTVPTALQRTSLEGQPAIPVAKFSGDDAGSGAVSYAASETGGGNASSGEPSARFEQLEEVIVTGTYIRGATPTGSPLKIYGREEIEQSGATTLDQFARKLPENFASVDAVANAYSNVGFARFNSASGNNSFAGSGFNLRGIGPTSTLTLLNGRRLAPAGFDGSLSDISLVPLSAIDHIEVLADGASAIYGADAVAGVVNMITRKEFSGAETGLRYGGATDGGAIERGASQLLGSAWSTGNGLLGYEYTKQEGLDASERDYIAEQGGPSSLIPENRLNSFFLSGSQDLGTRTRVSADAIASDRAFSTFVTRLGSTSSQKTVVSGRAKQSSIAAAINRNLASTWEVELSANYSKVEQSNHDDTESVFGPFSLTVPSISQTDSDVRGLNLLMNGSAFSLPSGDAKVAFGGSWRTEKFDSLTASTLFGETLELTIPQLDRDVTSAYAEVFLPIVGASNSLPLLRRLDLSAAVRYDDYSDFGSSTNPKVGVAWEPVSGLQIRGTYGRSFRAPLLSQIGSPTLYSTIFFADSASPAGIVEAVSVAGGNPELRPEESRSFTAGFDVKPTSLPGLSVSATYFEIDFDDRITLPPVAGLVDLGDPILAPFITRNPSLADVEAIFASPNFTGDTVGLGPAGVGAIFDFRTANIATTQESGFDVAVRYATETEIGNFAAYMALNRLFENDYQATSTVPAVELLDAFGQPTRWKGRANLSWSKGGLAASASINYVDDYRNTLSAEQSRIGSWVTADLYLGFSTSASQDAYLLQNLKIALSVQNVTDKEPPFVLIPSSSVLPGQNPLPFDPANASPMGRFVSLLVTKRW